jgi:hypothetical protein
MPGPAAAVKLSLSPRRASIALRRAAPPAPRRPLRQQCPARGAGWTIIRSAAMFSGL